MQLIPVRALCEALGHPGLTAADEASLFGRPPLEGLSWQACALRSFGANHVILNFKYGKRDADDMLEEFGQKIPPILKAAAPSVP